MDEARWGVEFYRRNQRPDGGITVGLFENLWPRPGETSWTDSMTWYSYAEDPLISFRYAAIGAEMARVLRNLGKAKEADLYRDSSLKAFDWAQQNLRPGDEAKVQDDRLWASASLFRSTGMAKFDVQFQRDLKIKSLKDPIYVYDKVNQTWGVWTYLLSKKASPETADLLKSVAVRYATENFVDTAKRRSFRIAKDWYAYGGWGTYVMPNVMAAGVAHKLTGDRSFLDCIQTTCDVTLGGNPLNMSWITRTGSRSPVQVMHFDSHYAGKGVVPGLVPFGPHHDDASLPAAGPWDPGYMMKTCYPPAAEWPTYELWFENRHCAATSEFTVTTNSGATAAFGLLLKR